MAQSQEHLDMIARAKVLRDTRAQALHGAVQPTRPMDEDSYWAAKAKAERGVAQPKFTPPTLSEVYAPSREAASAAKAEAERARIAALTPAQIRRSTLPWSEQRSIARWEAVNRMPWPEP